MPCESTKASSDIEHVEWSTGTGSGHHYANVRFGSGSSQASQSSGDICRICHCESDPQNPLLTPCYCAGSLKYVHQSCLQQWLTASETNSCELCKFPFIMHTKIKPFNEWRSLDISGIERRRLCCSVLFHCAAALCVIWSLCVLIERAADDVKRGLIDWPFWTKLAVVTVGLTGGVVFMYIQCKAYLHLCHRWKARNRILLIQNAPEKVHPMSPPSPAAATHHRSRSSEPRGSSILGGHLGGNSAGVGPDAVNGAAATGCGYNYATSAGVCGGMGGGGGHADAMDGATSAAAAAALQHHLNQLHRLPSSASSVSPHHMLQQIDLDLGCPRTSASGILEPSSSSSCSAAAGAGVHMPSGMPVGGLGQVAVSANIECSQSQHNYERDWALDDVVSQISSFRPCPQGSGSMTPFHDSIHNVLEHSESSSRGSVNDICAGSRHDLSVGISSDNGGRGDHALQLSSFSGSGEHKAPSISSGVSNAVANGLGGFVYKPHTKRYSNSSIFLENRDILNDSLSLGTETTEDYPRINYRHSSILTPPGAADTDQLERFLGKDLRRYSDTKLLSASGSEVDPSADARVRQMLLPKQHLAAADTILDMELPTSPLSPPAAYAAGQLQQPPPTLHRSMNIQMEEAAQRLPGAAVITAASGRAGVHHHSKASHNAGGGGGSSSGGQATQGRLFFKSLPNLSASCENLLQK